MKNLKIRTKLLVGFGLVLAMLFAILISAIVGINGLNATIKTYKNVSVPTDNLIWQMRRDMLSIQRYLLISITTTDDADLAAANNSLATDSTSLANSLEVLKKNTAVDTAKVNEFGNLMAQAAAVRTQMDQFIKLNTDVGNKQAFDIFMKQYKPVFDNAASTLITIAKEQQSAINELGLKADLTSNLAYMLLIVVAIIALVISVLVILLITKSILTPVLEIEKAAKDMTNGKLDTSILYSSHDELGSLADSMRSSMGKIRVYISDIDMALGEMANGNFDIGEPKQSFVGDFKNIEDSIRRLVTQMSQTLSQIVLASEQVSSGADQVSSGAQALAQGATEQASSVEELSASINDISHQVKQNAENAGKANAMANGAQQAITTGNAQMQQLMDAMDLIHSKSNEISKIIKTIEDIAFQTNILALNAAVEAARAGAAGKGFAVVADEVRNLANKSSEAAKNTTALIEDSVVSINEGVKLTEITAKELAGVVESVKKTTTVISEISKASGEQASAIAQVTIGLDQISSVVQTNSATSEESAAASEELSSQANLLKSLVSRFTLKKELSVITPDTEISFHKPVAAPKKRKALTTSSSDKY